MDWRVMILKNIWTPGVSLPPPWGIHYTCILQKYSKIFTKTAVPIKAKFCMKHLQEKGINVFINNLGHMTFQKSSTPEPVD